MSDFLPNAIVVDTYNRNATIGIFPLEDDSFFANVDSKLFVQLKSTFSSFFALPRITELQIQTAHSMRNDDKKPDKFNIMDSDNDIDDRCERRSSLASRCFKIAPQSSCIQHRIGTRFCVLSVCFAALSVK